MSDRIEDVEDFEEELVPEGVEEQSEESSEEPTGTSNTAESEARAQGWRPLSEFKGDPDDWVDAKSFLERGERNAPMMRERNRKLASMVERQMQELADMKRAQEIQAKMQDKLFARAREEALEKIREEQKLAVENGDVAKYEAAEAKRSKIADDFKPVVEQPQQHTKPTEIQRFEDENDWYHDDIVMQGAANALHAKIIRENPTMPLSRQLAKVKEGIVARFPDKFENPKRSNQGANPGGKPKTPVKKVKGWDDIPQKDREWAEKSVRRSGVSKESWAKDYWDLSNI